MITVDSFRLGPSVLTRDDLERAGFGRKAINLCFEEFTGSAPLYHTIKVFDAKMRAAQVERELQYGWIATAWGEWTTPNAA